MAPMAVYAAGRSPQVPRNQDVPIIVEWLANQENLQDVCGPPSNHDSHYSPHCDNEASIDENAEIEEEI